MNAEHKALETRLAVVCGELGHWCWVARHNSMQETRGMVDALVLGHGRVGFIELKSEDGRRTREQIKVGRYLTEHGYFYRCYRTSDFTAGTVRKELEEL